ncbi:MAG TPA: hypothetical protein VLA62_11530, partial [Solirubrobacterales bacterium]|nr:hypothetical protein [Solirubrobacterales bacterium]
LVALDEFRHQLGRPFVVHGAVEERSGDSEHPHGTAVDGHVVGLPLLEAWLFAERFPAFRGIGVYPHWHQPGLHLDVRDTPTRARWWRDQHGVYRSIERDFREFIQAVEATIGATGPRAITDHRGGNTA